MASKWADFNQQLTALKGQQQKCNILSSTVVVVAYCFTGVDNVVSTLCVLNIWTQTYKLTVYVEFCCDIWLRAVQSVGFSRLWALKESTNKNKVKLLKWMRVTLGIKCHSAVFKVQYCWASVDWIKSIKVLSRRFSSSLSFNDKLYRLISIYIHCSIWP